MSSFFGMDGVQYCRQSAAVNLHLEIQLGMVGSELSLLGLGQEVTLVGGAGVQKRLSGRAEKGFQEGQQRLPGRPKFAIASVSMFEDV